MTSITPCIDHLRRYVESLVAKSCQEKGTPT